jgi:hypothetical protein
MPIEILEDRIAPATISSVVVKNLADSGAGSLRAAILQVDASSNGANNIIFANGLHGTIKLKSALPTITESVSIGGVTAARITIDGDNDFQIFNISGGSLNVAIDDLKLQHGNSQNVGGSPTRGGGAIYVNDYSGTVKITDCTITKSRAVGFSGAKPTPGLGGGIDLAAGTMIITETKITGNLAQGASGTNPSATGTNGEGGGIYVGSSGNLTVNLCTISGNTARGGNGTAGAPGAAGSGSTAAATGGRGGGGGAGQGGGLWNYGITTVDRSTISGNTAIGGRGAKGGAGGTGAAGDKGGTGGNGGSGGFGEGGGVYNEATAPANMFALKLNSSTISGNVADGNASGKAGAGGHGGQGGSAGSHGYNPVKSQGYGGGVDSANATLELVDATVAKNVADKGGGIYLYDDIATQLDNSTIAFNRARSHAGAYGGGLAGSIVSGDAVLVISTVIGDNSAAAHGAGQDLWLNANNNSLPISAFASLIESFSTGSITGNTTPGSAFYVIEGENPMLDGLHANGGPTLTCKPVSYKSPLVGAGTLPLDLGSQLPNLPTVTYDQRGDLRAIAGTVDIGSVEIA